MTLAEQLDAEMAEMSERHLRNLAELAEIGMELSRAVKRRVAEVAAAGEQDHMAELGELGLTLPPRPRNRTHAPRLAARYGLNGCGRALPAPGCCIGRDWRRTTDRDVRA